MDDLWRQAVPHPCETEDGSSKQCVMCSVPVLFQLQLVPVQLVPRLVFVTLGQSSREEALQVFVCNAVRAFEEQPKHSNIAPRAKGRKIIFHESVFGGESNFSNELFVQPFKWIEY